MANKEKEQSTIVAPVKKELTFEAIHAKLMKTVEEHNTLAKEREGLVQQASNHLLAMTKMRGEITALENLQKDYFPSEELSVNGEK